MDKNFVDFLLLPEEFLPIYVNDASDMYIHRSLLRRFLFNDYVLNHLLDIVINTIERNVKFRTLDCLKVIKAILKNNPFVIKLENRTFDKLFYLYKIFILHKNEEVRACVNLFIRFQHLADDNIHWLISNFDKSEHSLNRLLRYPQRHPLITQWAKNMYQHGCLRDRCSEVIALFIDENIPPFVIEDENTIIWAIYYSRISDERKQQLFMQRFSFENLESLWEVSIRLRYPIVIEFMRTKVREARKDK